MPVDLKSKQFLILRILEDGEEHWGRHIREILRQEGYTSTNQSFYEMIDRLDTDGLVKKRSKPRELKNGSTNEELCYKITDEGREALKEAFTFYAPGRILGARA